MEYRTKSTVEESILKDIRIGDTSRLVEYQPGNGTRYLMMVTDLRGSLPARQWLGLGSETSSGWVITRLDSPASMVISGQMFLHWSYVADKLRVNKADAVVLAELIGYLTGTATMSCAQVREREAKEEAEEEDDDVSDLVDV